MNAKKFKHQNETYAKDQPEYHPLPVLKITVPRLELEDPEGHVIFCMGLTFWERIRVLFLGQIWCSLMTYGHLTPSYHSTNRKDCYSIPYDSVSWKQKLNDFLNYGAMIYYQEKIKIT